jgi:hypothetical protein
MTPTDTVHAVFVAGAIKYMMTAAVVIFAECRKRCRVPQNTECDAHIAACAAAVTRVPLHILARDVHSWWMDAGANVSTGAAMLHARFMLLGGRSINKLSVTAVQPCLSDADVKRPLQEGSMMPQPGKHTTQTTCSCNFCGWSA